MQYILGLLTPFVVLAIIFIVLNIRGRKFREQHGGLSRSEIGILKAFRRW